MTRDDFKKYMTSATNADEAPAALSAIHEGFMETADQLDAVVTENNNIKEELNTLREVNRKMLLKQVTEVDENILEKEPPEGEDLFDVLFTNQVM